MRIFKYKKTLSVILIIIAGFLILIVGTAVNELWKGYKWQKATDQFQESLEQPYKEDIYGGKTPEETWAMYIDALKKGDIDLASRYYAVRDQEKKGEFLIEERKIDDLKLYLEQLSAPLQKDGSLPDFILVNKERAYYYYMVKDLETGEMIKNNVNLYLNPYTKVWKILY